MSHFHNTLKIKSTLFSKKANKIAHDTVFAICRNPSAIPSDQEKPPIKSCGVCVWFTMLITASNRLPLAVFHILAIVALLLSLSCLTAATAMINDDDNYDNDRVGTGHHHRWSWDKGGHHQYWCYS